MLSYEILPLGTVPRWRDVGGTLDTVLRRNVHSNPLSFIRWLVRVSSERGAPHRLRPCFIEKPAGRDWDPRVV